MFVEWMSIAKFLISSDSSVGRSNPGPLNSQGFSNLQETGNNSWYQAKGYALIVFMGVSVKEFFAREFSSLCEFSYVLSQA